MRHIHLLILLIVYYQNTTAQLWQQNKVTRSQGLEICESADLDNDGDLDIISVQSGNNLVYVFENNGSGIFPDLPIYSANISNAYPGLTLFINDFIVEDVDGDNLKDVVLTYFTDSDSFKLAWIKNIGNLEFGSLSYLFTYNTMQCKTLVSDFDLDGDLDIFTENNLGNDSSDYYFFQNNGTGGFVPTYVTTSYQSSGFAFMTDKDNDGDDDIIVGDKWFNNDIGSFNLQNNSYYVGPYEIPVVLYPYSIFDDFNNDGYNDLVRCNYDAVNEFHQIIFTEGDAIGSYITLLSDTINFSSICDYDFSFINSFDADQDGDKDILGYFSALWSFEMGWLENDGTGNFISYHHIDSLTYDDLSGAVNVLTRDLNDDGKEDILVNSNNELRLTYYKNEGNGIFSYPKSITLYDDPERVNSCDFNGDGKVELMTTSYENLTSSVYFQFDDGKYYEQQIIFPQLISQQYSYLCDHLDFDNDGDEDFLGAYKGGAYESNLAFYVNDNGIFEGYFLVDDSLDHINQMFICDFNFDNFKDIVVITSSLPFAYENAVILFTNNQMGGFTKDTLLFDSDLTGINSRNFQDIRLADFNNDGFTDFILADASTNEFSWFENDGLNNFSSTILITFPSAYTPSRLCIGDLNNDGLMDFCVSTFTHIPSPPPVYFIINDGAGSFTPNLLTAQGDGVGLPIYIEDFNNDGQSDILISEYNYGDFYDGDLKWYVNDGNANFNFTHLVSDKTTSYYSLDYVDNDSLIDIVAINCGDPILPQLNSVVWYKNPGLNLGYEITNYPTTLHIYPSPADDFITINTSQLDISEDAYIKLFSSSGVEVANQKNIGNYNTIDVSQLSPGVYVVCLYSNSNVLQQKIIIN